MTSLDPSDHARPEEPPRDDRALDEALAETFPASDPPANTVETGVRIGEAAPDDDATTATGARTERIFPVLTAPQIARMASHGSRRATRRGEVLIDAGQANAS